MIVNECVHIADRALHDCKDQGRDKVFVHAAASAARDSRSGTTTFMVPSRRAIPGSAQAAGPAECVAATRVHMAFGGRRPLSRLRNGVSRHDHS
jgi:hypothetical protein